MKKLLFILAIFLISSVVFAGLVPVANPDLLPRMKSTYIYTSTGRTFYLKPLQTAYITDKSAKVLLIRVDIARCLPFNSWRCFGAKPRAFVYVRCSDYKGEWAYIQQGSAHVFCKYSYSGRGAFRLRFLSYNPYSGAAFIAYRYYSPYPYPTPQPKYCRDTDGGRNYYVKGYVYYNGRIYSDFCSKDGLTLYEYYCEGNSVKSSTFKVNPAYYRCVNGRIVSVSYPTPYPTPWPVPPAKCYDSDGGRNYYVRGTVTKGYQKRTDYCINSRTLVEYYCCTQGNISKEIYYVDGIRRRCVGGRIVRVQPTPGPTPWPTPTCPGKRVYSGQKFTLRVGQQATLIKQSCYNQVLHIKLLSIEPVYGYVEPCGNWGIRTYRVKVLIECANSRCAATYTLYPGSCTTVFSGYRLNVYRVSQSSAVFSFKNYCDSIAMPQNQVSACSQDP